MVTESFTKDAHPRQADERLAPRFHERLATAVATVFGGGWRRRLRLRQLAAAVLVVLAGILAFAPGTGPPRGSPVVVAAVEIPAGATVGPADVAVREWPAGLAPTGALHGAQAAVGHVLVGAAHAGEALTDLRLVGAGPVPPGQAAVPIRVTDAGVAALLTPGSRVDVGAPGEHADQPVELASDATVVAVLAEEKGARGRMVLVSMPRATAGRVASAALNSQVSITLR